MPEINYLVFRECVADWRVRRHLTSAYDITYLTGGSAEYTLDGKVSTLLPGDLVCLAEGTEKEAHTWPDRLMRCFSVNFSPALGGGGAPPLPFPRISRIGPRPELIRLFRDLTFAWVEQRPGYRLKSRGLLLLILHRLYELTGEPEFPRGDYRVRKACRHIAERYGEKLSVGALAALVNLNPVYFGALFKKETGLPVHRYIARTRVRNAENLLRSGEYKVFEAAERCGYQDVFHFYKQFRAIMGFPPSRCIPRRS
jgi:AraC-like DNA-binding protein